jgi:cutinase
MQALSLLLFAVAAIASPISQRETGHTVQSIDIDTAIYSKIDNLFSKAAASSSPAIRVRQSSDTRNDLIDGMCDDVIIIFARGTYGAPNYAPDPLVRCDVDLVVIGSGNIGTGIGPAFVDAVSAAEPGRVIVQGVLPYPALVSGYLAGGSEIGADSMAALTSRAASQCPSARIVLGGYSQGAQVTHKAAARLNSALFPRIAGIVLFGDPNNVSNHFLVDHPGACAGEDEI